MNHRHLATVFFICVFSVRGCVYHNESIYEYILQNVSFVECDFTEIYWASCEVCIVNISFTLAIKSAHKDRALVFTDIMEVSLKIHFLNFKKLDCYAV